MLLKKYLKYKIKYLNLQGGVASTNEELPQPPQPPQQLQQSRRAQQRARRAQQKTQPQQKTRQWVRRAQLPLPNWPTTEHGIPIPMPIELPPNEDYSDLKFASDSDTSKVNEIKHDMSKVLLQTRQTGPYRPPKHDTHKLVVADKQPTTHAKQTKPYRFNKNDTRKWVPVDEQPTEQTKSYRPPKLTTHRWVVADEQAIAPTTHTGPYRPPNYTTNI
jgi:hypothetical protein